MYWKYCLKRLAHGLWMYAVIIFIFSALFNATMEKTVRAQIEDSIHEEAIRVQTAMKPEEMATFLEERRAAKYRLYHLDQPAWKRVVWRAIDTLAFRFGDSTLITSSAGDTAVWNILIEALPRTILLFTSAIALDIFIGIWFGLKQAQRVGGWLDKLMSLATMTVYGMPTWWLGMLMIMAFSYVFKLFPSGGMHATPPPSGLWYYLDVLHHLALPTLTLVLLGFWGRALLTRNIVLGILQEDYIMAARARGLPERRVLYGHVMRTASPPLTTMALLSLLSSIGGNLVIEGIFSWPGLGNLYWIAIEQNDIPVLMGSLAITTALYMFGLVALDLIYGYLDPRIKVGGKA